MVHFSVGRVEWKQELSNQILGALKVLLHPFGVSLSLGLPSAISSKDRRLFSKDDATRGFLVEFGTRDGTEVSVVVWLSVSLAEGLDLSREAAAATKESIFLTNNDMDTFFFTDGVNHG